VTDLRQSPQGTPLLFPRRHPQLLVISPIITPTLIRKIALTKTRKFNLL
jgi:hypothetical protein